MRLWISDCSLIIQCVFLISMHRSGYSAVWLLLGWCHVKLLPDCSQSYGQVMIVHSLVDKLVTYNSLITDFVAAGVHLSCAHQLPDRSYHTYWPKYTILYTRRGQSYQNNLRKALYGNTEREEERKRERESMHIRAYWLYKGSFTHNLKQAAKGDY